MINHYKMTGRSGEFDLVQVSGGLWRLLWKRAPAPGRQATIARSFEVHTEDLYDLALLGRELVDVIEQAIADEIKADQEAGAVWEPDLSA